MTANNDFLREVFIELNKKVDENHQLFNDRLDEKLEASENRICQEIHSIRETISRKLDNLESEVNSQGKVLVKHEHGFSLVNKALMGAFGGIGLAVGYIWTLLQGKH